MVNVTEVFVNSQGSTTASHIVRCFDGDLLTGLVLSACCLLLSNMKSYCCGLLGNFIYSICQTAATAIAFHVLTKMNYYVCTWLVQSVPC